MKRLLCPKDKSAIWRFCLYEMFHMEVKFERSVATTAAQSKNARLQRI
jgi:hypothetical protein